MSEVDIIDVIDHYDQEHALQYVGSATNHQLQNLQEGTVIYTVLKALCIKDNIEYYTERININGLNGIFNSNSTDLVNDRNRLYGFDIDAEDPRLVLYRNKIYMLFNIQNPDYTKGIYSRIMCISEYDNFHPVQLHVSGMGRNHIEKNWSPFVKDDKLYLVYSIDPLVILHYDFNPEGRCDVVYTQDNITLPINTTNCLRGGSNLLPYRDGYYIGLCHSRINTTKRNIGGYEFCYYLALVIIIDTNQWRVSYLSKPLMFTIDVPIVKRIGEIIFDESPWLFTNTPTSLNQLPDGEYLLTVNINEIHTFKYQWKPEIDVDTLGANPLHKINDWNELAKQRSIELIKRASIDAYLYLPK